MGRGQVAAEVNVDAQGGAEGKVNHWFTLIPGWSTTIGFCWLKARRLSLCERVQLRRACERWPDPASARRWVRFRFSCCSYVVSTTLPVPMLFTNTTRRSAGFPLVPVNSPRMTACVILFEGRRGSKSVLAESTSTNLSRML